MTKRIVLSALIAFSLAIWVPLTAQAEDRVVVSIKPIHSLAAFLMEGIGQPALLIQGNASVHGYQLKPSDAKLLDQADLVIWVGPNLETSVGRAIESLSQNARTLELGEVAGLTLHTNRHSPDEFGDHNDEHGESEEGHDDEDEHEEDHHDDGHEREHDESDEEDHDDDEHHHDHEPGELDMHIWLDLQNAKVISQAIADVLYETYPQHEHAVQANLKQLLAELDSLDHELKGQVKQIAGRPYIVFHDAYQYLEKNLGLNNVGAVTLNPERSPSVKKVGELKETVHRTDAVCAFAEPQFNPSILHVVTEDANVKIGTLDPLGWDIEPGSEAYFQIMRNLVNSFTECLE